MANKQIKEKIEEINKILKDNNLVIVPVTTIVNNVVSQRVDVVEKPKKTE